MIILVGVAASLAGLFGAYWLASQLLPDPPAGCPECGALVAAGEACDPACPARHEEHRRKPEPADLVRDSQPVGGRGRRGPARGGVGQPPAVRA
jgi:hypothetical protein